MKFSAQIIAHPMKLLINRIVDLVYPPACLVCEQRLDITENQTCHQCLSNFTLLGKAHERFSVPGEIYLNTAWALFDFDPAFQSLIHHLKYSKRRKPILTVLNHYMHDIEAQLGGNHYDFIVSIPLHSRKLRERGYNQVDDMTDWFVDLLDAKNGNYLVKRKKYTQSQTKLTAAERQANVAQAFGVKKTNDIIGKSFLLIDDVLTTGATANTLAQVLHAAKASQIDLVTLSTPKHGNT